MEKAKYEGKEFIWLNNELATRVNGVYKRNKWAQGNLMILARLAAESQEPSETEYVKAMGDAEDILSRINELGQEIFKRHQDAMSLVEEAEDRN